jgi:hypothetical protein
MKPIKLCLLCLGLVLLFGGLTAVVHTQYKVVEVQKFDMVAIVEPMGMGMGFNGSQIMFGKVDPGHGVAKRSLIVYNNASYPVVARFRMQGNISQYVYFNVTEPVIGPYSDMELFIFFEPAENAAHGVYWGTLTAILSRG